MSQISSINFKKSVDFQVFHNSTVRPNYAIGGELIANRKGYEALKLKEQIVNQAIETYKSRTKRAFQAKSYEWSAVCNIKPDTTMQDLERLAEHFEEKYGFQCYQIAIHRDEGHIDDDNNKVINHHAHLEFITLDKNTGRNRQRDLKPEILRQIQTEVAEILNMERGQDKRISKLERVEPRKYAQIKEQERKNTRKLKQELEAKDNVIQAKNQVIQDKDQELEDEKLSKKRLKEQIEAKNQQHIEQIKQEAQEQENKIKEIFYDEIDKLETEIKDKDKVIQAKNQELEQEKLSKAELKKELEKLRQNSKNQGFSKEFFQEINLEKKKLRFKNKLEFFNWVEELRERHTKKSFLSSQLDSEAFFEDMYKVYQEQDKVIQSQDQEIQALKAENNEIKAQKHTLTQEQIQEIINQALAQKEAEIEKIKKEAREREAQKNQEIQTLKTKNTELKNEKERFNELLESNPALKEAYNQALEALKNREKTPNNEELMENNRKQATYFLNNFFKDDVSIFSKTNTDKIEHSEQDQTHNEDELGIDKILIHKNEDKTQEDNKPKIHKHR